MACSKYEYVKKFESNSTLLPNTYIVVRIDGKGFTKFTASHGFEKPNDKKGLDLMNKAALSVMETFNEIIIAYGQSDEFSFVFKKRAELYQRRSEKIISCLVSCFTASYAIHFSDFFGSKPEFLPMFDARAVSYPDLKNLRDYLSWRQVDCHINNLYNTCFWTMVQKGNMTPQVAQGILKDTLSDKKNEILFTDYAINYSKIDPQFRKGSSLIRIPVIKEKHNKNQIEENLKIDEQERDQNSNQMEQFTNESKQQDPNIEIQPSIPIKKGETGKKEKKISQKKQNKIDAAKYHLETVIIFEDIISDDFWEKYKQSLQEEQ